jgi:hypothetical protein
MKTITLQQPKSKPGYDFFYRSQLIFTPYQAGQRIYAVLEGQVALYNGSYRVFTIQAGHCLVEDQLRQSGWVAVAQTNCRLVAIDAATYAAFAKVSPSFVLGTIRPPHYESRQPNAVQIRWPASLLARRQLFKEKK